MADYNDPMMRMDDDYEDHRRHRVARGVVIMVVSVLVLGVFVAGVTIAYQLGMEAGNSKVTPIIRADTGPTKVRPKEPGGMKIPNQDKTVYGQIAQTNGQTKDEKLLPNAERPIESLLLSIRPAITPSTDEPAKTDKKSLPIGTTAKAPPVELPPPPPPEKPVPKRPTGPEVTKTTKATKNASKEIVAAVTPPPPPPAPGVTTTKPAKPAKAAKPAKTVKKKTQVASAKPTAPKSTKKPAAKGAYVVQLASAKSAKGLRRTWSKLRQSHPSLFKGLNESVVKKNLGPKKGVWYRLRAGAFANASAARAFCARAKKRKVGCLATRR